MLIGALLLVDDCVGLDVFLDAEDDEATDELLFVRWLSDMEFECLADLRLTLGMLRLRDDSCFASCGTAQGTLGIGIIASGKFEGLAIVPTGRRRIPMRLALFEGMMI